MTRTEQAARQLASELSDRGEADWIEYIRLAEQVGDRLDADFRRLFERPAPDDCERRKQARAPGAREDGR